MLQFAGSVNSSTVIKSIKLYNSGLSEVANIQMFSGSVVEDGDNSYIVIDFEMTPANNFTVSKIELCSDSAAVASYTAPEGTSIITATTGKLHRIRFSAKFTGAANCVLKTTSVNLPYATPTRDGVVRLYSERDTSDADKLNVVYSARDIDVKLSGIISDNGFVPWDSDAQGNTTVHQLKFVNNYITSTDGITVKTTDGNNLTIDGTINGAAVSSSPTIENGSITGSDKLVTETYVSGLYTNTVTQNETKLVSSGAVYNYISNNTASTITDNDTKFATSDAVYEYVDGVGNNLVHKTGAETVAGTKTFSDALVASTSVSSTSYIGSGVLSSTTVSDWSVASNTAKLPTVASTKSYIDGQIDACITSASYDSESHTILFKNGSNTISEIDATNFIKDGMVESVVVGEDETLGDCLIITWNEDSDVAEPTKIPLTDIFDPSNYYSTSQADSIFLTQAAANNTYLTLTNAANTYLTQSDAANTYITQSAAQSEHTSIYNSISSAVTDLQGLIAACVQKTDIDTSISSTSTDQKVPSSKAVYTYVTTTLQDYAKLDANNAFTGTTNTFSGTVSVSGTASTGALVCSGGANVGSLFADDDIQGSEVIATTSVSSPSYAGDGILSSYVSNSWTDTNDQLPTVKTVKEAIETNVPSILVGMADSIDSLNAADVKIGTIGLFALLNNETALNVGSTVDGSHLYPFSVVFRSNGNVTSSASETSMSGTWTLLSMGMNVSGNNKALVLAMRTA